MAPSIGRIAFTTGLSVFLLALLMLPTLDPESPEFVADVLALLISGVFLLLVVISVRRAARLPTIPLEHEDPKGHECTTPGTELQALSSENQDET